MNIDASLVSRLIADQFPHLARLKIDPVATSGWDNRTFRLGHELLVRMPAAARYAVQVEVEQAWLPRLAPALPLPIPTVVAMGEPGAGYPWRWSIYGWIVGAPLSLAGVGDEVQVAADLGAFLQALQSISTDAGPPAGARNFHRGGSLGVYDGEMQRAITALPAAFDRGALAELWADALASQWSGAPVWIHGDVAPGNLLAADGRLCAVIDFGQIGVGDPACDLTMRWTFFSERGAEAFRAALPLDAATWRRARGWAAWKAAILLTGVTQGPEEAVNQAGGVLSRVLTEFRVDPAAG